MREFRKVVMAVVLVAAGSAHATTATSNMACSAQVSAACTISAGALAFGTYDTIGGAQLDGSATLTVVTAVSLLPAAPFLGQMVQRATRRSHL